MSSVEKERKEDQNKIRIEFMTQETRSKTFKHMEPNRPLDFAFSFRNLDSPLIKQTPHLFLFSIQLKGYLQKVNIKVQI